MMKLETRLKSYWSKITKGGPDDCWPWTGSCNTKGYGCIGWNNKQQGTHRVSWVLANGPIPEGMMVLHRCDNPKCQNPNHLFLGTNQDNIDDKMAKGRHRGARGERSGSAKFTTEQVVEIRRKWKTGNYTQGQLAAEYMTSRKYIQVLVAEPYRVWKEAVS